MAVKSSSSLKLSDGEAVTRASDNRNPTDEQSNDGIDQGDDSDKKQFVPMKKGRIKKVKSKNSSSALSTAGELLKKLLIMTQQHNLCLFSRRKISELVSMN